MDFRIADTFTDALTRLPAQDQKAVKVGQKAQPCKSAR
jgi:hypothetical protein